MSGEERSDSGVEAGIKTIPLAFPVLCWNQDMSLLPSGTCPKLILQATRWSPTVTTKEPPPQPEWRFCVLASYCPPPEKENFSQLMQARALRKPAPPAGIISAEGPCSAKGAMGKPGRSSYQFAILYLMSQ